MRIFCISSIFKLAPPIKVPLILSIELISLKFEEFTEPPYKIWNLSIFSFFKKEKINSDISIISSTFGIIPVPMD